MSFSRLRFDHYARELSLAIYDLSLESRTPFHELTQDLRNVVDKGRRDPVQPVPNRKHFRHLDEKRQRRTMSETEGTATTLPTVDIAPAKPIDTAPTSNITGLLSGAFKDKLAEMRLKIADRQKQALAKIDGAVMNGAMKIEAAAEDVASKVDKEISAALQEFAQHTNGGPA